MLPYFPGIPAVSMALPRQNWEMIKFPRLRALGNIRYNPLLMRHIAFKRIGHAILLLHGTRRPSSISINLICARSKLCASRA